MDCIFCKIVGGEIPAVKVLEENLVLAFMDINPASPGHLLVIPKEHAENIFEIPESDLAAAIKAAKRCARAAREALNAEGVTVLQLNGRVSGQVVPHLHIHVIPRWEDNGLAMSSWEMNPGDMDEIKAIAQKIRDHMPASS